MKKIIILTGIVILIGFIFLNSNSFVEEEKQVVVEDDANQTSLVNVYFVQVNKQNNQVVIPVKRKVSKDNIHKNTIQALLMGPNETEVKKLGLSSEIPTKTRLIKIGEFDDMIILDFSKDIESGGGSDSVTLRLEQIADTVSDMTEKPVYLYIGGKEASVLGGDGVIVKQPINEIK